MLIFDPAMPAILAHFAFVRRRELRLRPLCSKNNLMRLLCRHLFAFLAILYCIAL